MHRVRAGFGLLLAVLLGLAGCTSSNNLLRPPPRPDELVDPPAEDARYSNPPKYPADAMNQDKLFNKGGSGNPMAGGLPPGSMGNPGQRMGAAGVTPGGR